MTASALRSLTLAEIVEGCQQEQRRSRLAEIGHCFELFRRAVEQRDEAALRSLQLQYGRLVLRWAYDLLPRATETQVEDVADKAFLKFQGTLNRRVSDVQASFKHVGALLGYLKRCVVSSAIDHQHSEERHARAGRLLMARQQILANGRQDDAILERVDQAALFQRVAAWFEREVADPDERLVIALSYGQGLPPSEIATRHPDRFADEKAVNRIKERVLKRARRALAAQALPTSEGASEKPPARR